MKHICIWLIRFYQKFLSPLKGRPCCRFTPTCSAYALQAYQKRGFFPKRVQERLEQQFEEEMSDNDDIDSTNDLN